MIQRGKPRPVTLLTAVAFATVLAALLAIALFPIFPRQLEIHPGDIASRTLRAPRGVSFESSVLTNQRREEAANAVPPSLVFDPAVRTQKLNDYDRETAQITQVRDQATEPARKRDALAQLGLSARSIDTVLGLSAEQWTAVAAEGRRVLQQQLGVSLDEGGARAARDNIDAQITVDFVADQALLTAEMVRPFIVPTLVVDQDRTAQAQAAARAAVPPERINIEKNDVILDAGSRVDDVAIEKLRAAGLLSRTVEWRNVAAVVLLSVVVAGAVAGFVYVMQPGGVTSERHMIALALVMAAPLLIAKFYLPVVMPDEHRHFLAFILPVAAAPILVAALLETEVAVVVSAFIGALVAFISVFIPDVSLVTAISSTDTIRLLLVYGLAPIAGIYMVHRAGRLSRYMGAGIAVAAVTYVVLVATWFVDGDRTSADLAWMALSAAVGGISSGVIAAGAFVTVGVLFGVTTRVQLMELSQLNSPLLRRLQDEAPGTFHHSIIVGNLAERAADLVGADPLLTRVGCYYHDIGKVLQPGMYIENQLGGGSPHEQLSPEESAAVIQEHVRNGLELARREGLPERVQAFIPEHHGTRLVTYFYRTAAERDPGVDPEQFQYPGPRPQSKETAIVMLADSTEAMIRSASDRSPQKIDQMVDEVIGERVAEGQLDDCDLTLRDLRTIAESFKGTMRAVYHPRVEYPKPTPMEARRRVLRLPTRTGGPTAGIPGLPPRQRRDR
ncbi:MAG TPA: HDIG domain-containing protein [Dehalococcoidia bacterium]|nr:HDIG domain-containing protein [Dehalococcoidia bacterium]